MRLAGHSPHLLTTFQAGLRSMMIGPIDFARSGYRCFAHSSQSRRMPIQREDVKLAERIGNQIAGAIANAQLYIERTQAEEAARRSEEEARRLAEENEIMAEIGRIISSTLDIEEVYERFAQEVEKIIPFDRIAINIINPKIIRQPRLYLWD